MKYGLLFIGLLSMLVILQSVIAPREGAIKYALLFAEVVAASVIIGIAVAHATNLR